jgi:hypothetical protein
LEEGPLSTAMRRIRPQIDGHNGGEGFPHRDKVTMIG